MGSPTDFPKKKFNLFPDQQIQTIRERRSLVWGLRTSIGTAITDTLILDAQEKTETELATLLGTGELFHRVAYWRLGNNNVSVMDILPVAPLVSTQSAGSITFTGGPVSTTGTINIRVTDHRLVNVDVVALKDESINDVATKVAAALNAVPNRFFNAAPSGAIVNLMGVDDTDWLALEKNIAVTSDAVGIGFTVVQWIGGSNTNVFTSTLDPIVGIRYTGVSWPQSNFTEFKEILIPELNTRFNSTTGTLLDGVGFTGFSGTAAAHKANVVSINSQSAVVAGNTISATGPNIQQPPSWTITEFLGIRERRLTTGVSISDVITTSAPRDRRGGPHTASLPYANTPLIHTPVVLPTDLFTSAEQEDLEDNGITVIGVDPSGLNMIMGPVVTTFLKDIGGNPNESFKYLNHVDTGSVSREIFFNELGSIFGQIRLTTGDLIPDVSIANAESIKTEVLRIYKFLTTLALTRAGPEAEGLFGRETIVSAVLATRTADINGPLPIVSQLGNINYDLQLNFNTAA